MRTISLLLSSIIFQVVTVQGFRSLSVSHNLLAENTTEILSDYVVDEKSLVSPGSVYGWCNRRNKDNCVLFMETSSNVDSLEHIRTCNFTLSNCGEKNKTKIFNIEVIAIDKDKAVLLTVTISSRDCLEILHFSDCKAIPVVMPVDIINNTELYVAKIGTPSDDVFDVYIYSPFPDKLYQAVYDFDGKIIMMKKWNDSFNYVFAEAVINSPLKGRLIVDKTYDKARDGHTIDIYTYDGSKQIIKKYPLLHEGLRRNNYATSTIFEHLSICTQANESTIICGQYDQNGVLIFESTLPFPKSSKILALKTFNLSGGGLILLIFECSSSQCEYPGSEFVVKKFNATGVYVGSLSVTKMPSLYESTPIHFYENEEKEMCLSMFNSAIMLTSNITFHIACFKDQDMNP